MPKPIVVIGFLGTQLDRHRSASEDRFQRWRPTIALCQQKGLPIARLELIAEAKFDDLTERVVADLKQVSPKTKVIVHRLAFTDPWAFEEMFGKLYDFVRTLKFDTEKEDYLIHLTTGTHVAQICWFLLTEARWIPARLIQTGPGKRGEVGRDPKGAHTIIDLDLSKYDRINTRFAAEQEQTLDFLKSGIATRSKDFNRLIEQIERVAVNSTAPILITGPTGAGKSMLAGRIYELRKQRASLPGRFVEVNCATLRGDQAMSALFGHKRGSFTGAQSDRAGLLKEADRGLVFLDEIGELGPDEQAMLLRALEDKTFLPLGSDKPVRSDFQLIAGTNRDLRADIASGKFREDLLARINLWTFTLPSLAERREDIEANLDYELERFSQAQRKQVRFNKEARDSFLRFARGPEAKWSANFRDLNAAITRMATLAPRGRITELCVEAEITRLRESWKRPGETAGVSAPLLEEVLTASQRAKLDPFDAVQLEYVVRVCRESKTLSDAGRKLFAMSRAKKTSSNDTDRVKKYLARFGLEWARL